MPTGLAHHGNWERIEAPKIPEKLYTPVLRTGPETQSYASHLSDPQLESLGLSARPTAWPHNWVVPRFDELGTAQQLGVLRYLEAKGQQEHERPDFYVGVAGLTDVRDTYRAAETVPAQRSVDAVVHAAMQ